MPRKSKANPKTTGEDDNDTNGHVEESVVETEREDEDTVVVLEEDPKEDTIADNGKFAQDESPMVQKSPHRSFTPSAAYLASKVIYLFISKF